MKDSKYNNFIFILNVLAMNTIKKILVIDARYQPEIYFKALLGNIWNNSNLMAYVQQKKYFFPACLWMKTLFAYS